MNRFDFLFFIDLMSIIVHFLKHLFFGDLERNLNKYLNRNGFSDAIKRSENFWSMRSEQFFLSNCFYENMYAIECLWFHLELSVYFFLFIRMQLFIVCIRIFRCILKVKRMSEFSIDPKWINGNKKSKHICANIQQHKCIFVAQKRKRKSLEN